MTPSPRLLEAGDSAALFTLGRVIDPAVNARAIAIADAVRARELPGVRDVVSTFGSVAVYFDPLTTDLAQVAAILANPPVHGEPVRGRLHHVPVAYGGEHGPDLDDVASRAGLTPEQVIARHAGVPYRVFMLGFQPGFAYLGIVDPAIAVPRRPTPRVRVPAGSVGIAGSQTGIYPAEAPGGWQLIGRALEPVFDDRQRPPARFAPGDTVVFRRSAGGVPAVTPSYDRPAPASARRITVLGPGLFTTVQDAGHWGEQRSGVTVSGAMDWLSHALANVAVGNDPSAAALEITIVGPEVRFDSEATIAVAGADLSAALDGVLIPTHAPVRAPAGSRLRFGTRRAGTRAYVAFDGGMEQGRVRLVRPVTANEELSLRPAGNARSSPGPVAGWPLPSSGARLRVVTGPQQDLVSADCLDALFANRFTVSAQSNRMGYRLTGAVVPSRAGDMVSDATFTGAVQIPPSGEPILLMADRQTTGGYPQVATVITADLPLAGQLAPGDWVEFVPCSRADAVDALRVLRMLVTGGR